VQQVPAQLRVAHLGGNDQRRGAVLGKVRLGEAAQTKLRSPRRPPRSGYLPDFHIPVHGVFSSQLLPAAAFHPRRCCISQAAPAWPLAAPHSIAGRGAEGSHLVLDVQGSLEITEDLRARDAATDSWGEGQRLRTCVPLGHEWDGAGTVPTHLHGAALFGRCHRPHPRGRRPEGESLGYRRTGDRQTARVDVALGHGRGPSRCQEPPCQPAPLAREGSSRTEDPSLAQHPSSLAAPCSRPRYLQQLADALWVAMLGCQVQGSVTWGEGQMDRSEVRQWVCGRGDQLGDRHTGGSAGLGLRGNGTPQEHHHSVLEFP